MYRSTTAYRYLKFETTYFCIFIKIFPRKSKSHTSTILSMKYFKTVVSQRKPQHLHPFDKKSYQNFQQYDPKVKEFFRNLHKIHGVFLAFLVKFLGISRPWKIILKIPGLFQVSWVAGNPAKTSNL